MNKQEEPVLRHISDVLRDLTLSDVQQALVRQLGLRWHYAVAAVAEGRRTFPNMDAVRFKETFLDDYEQTVKGIQDDYHKLGLPVDQSVFLEIEVSRVCPNIRERYERVVARRREQKAQGVDPRLNAVNAPSI